MSAWLFTASLIANPILAFFAGAYFAKWMRQRRLAHVSRGYVTYWQNGGLSR